MPLITVGAGAATDIKPGTYEGTLTAVNERMIVSTFNNPNNEEKPFFEWVFALSDGSEVQGLSSAFTGPKSTTFKYLVALMGADAVKQGADFELSDLVGKHALVQIGINDQGWPRIEGVFPPVVQAPAPVGGKVKPAPVSPIRAAEPEDVAEAFAVGGPVEDDLPF